MIRYLNYIHYTLQAVNMDKKSNIKIAIYGMDQRSQKMTEMVFKDNLPTVAVTPSAHGADVILFDMDSGISAEQIDEIRAEHSSIPVIVLSIKSQNVKGAVYLRKPLSVSSLSKTLEILVVNADKSISNSKVNINTSMDDVKMAANSGIQTKANLAASLDKHGSSAEKTSKNNVVTIGVSDDSCFDPSRFVIWYVKQAVEQAKSTQSVIQVTLWNNKFITINPASEKITTNLSDGTIRSIGVVAIDDKEGKIEIKKTDKKSPSALQSAQDEPCYTHNCDSFLWQLAAATARGRTTLQFFNENIYDISQPVYISKWPNITRLTDIPNSLRVIAFLIKRPATQSQVCKLLNVKRADFNNVLFACAALGIAGQAIRQSDQLFAVEEKPQHKSRKLFGYILSHLRVRS
jgi:hypothetical protein